MIAGFFCISESFMAASVRFSRAPGLGHHLSVHLSFAFEGFVAVPLHLSRTSGRGDHSPLRLSCAPARVHLFIYGSFPLLAEAALHGGPAAGWRGAPSVHGGCLRAESCVFGRPTEEAFL